MQRFACLIREETRVAVSQADLHTIPCGVGFQAYKDLEEPLTMMSCRG